MASIWADKLLLLILWIFLDNSHGTVRLMASSQWVVRQILRVCGCISAFGYHYILGYSRGEERVVEALRDGGCGRGMVDVLSYLRHASYRMSAGAQGM